MSKPLSQTQHVRAGGDQDRSSPNEDPITVEKDREDPVTVKKQLPMPAKQRLRKRHAEKLRRILVRAEEICSKLAEYHKLFIDEGTPYTSAAFLATLLHSYDTVLNNEKAILQVLKHNKDDGTLGKLLTRVQDDLDVADDKVRFVQRLLKITKRQKRALARILPYRQDEDTKFYISIR